MAPEDLKKDRDFLHQEFLRDAKVIDLERGYVSASSFNLRMKPSVLAAAARLIAHEFREEKIDIVHGIPPLRQLSGYRRQPCRRQSRAPAPQFPQRSKCPHVMERYFPRRTSLVHDE